MHTIIVDTGRMDGQVAALQEIKNELNRISAQVNTINRSLQWDVSISSAVKSNLAGHSQSVQQLGLKAGKMTSALQSAVSSYTVTENKNTGATNSEQGQGKLNEANDRSSSASEEVWYIRNTSTIEGRKRIVDQYEKEHPEDAELINEFFQDEDAAMLTEDDIIYIKMLIYEAPEPYKTVFLHSLSRYQIGSTTLDKNQAYYMPFSFQALNFDTKHTVNYSYPDSFGNDPRGPYTTFFHECGHAIDDLSDVSKWIGSDTENYKSYSSEIGKKVTLREAIEYDVFYNNNNPHSMTSIANSIINDGGSGSKGNINNVLQALKNGNSNGLNKEDTSLYNAIINRHQRTTGTDGAYEAVTDVYGGMTKNRLQKISDGKGQESIIGYHHGDEYWNDSKKQAKELWAEYFSYNMAKDIESVQNLNEYFPEASKIMQAYASTISSKR